jgi:hypothetical protein
MNKKIIIIAFSLLLILYNLSTAQYLWLDNYDSTQTISSRIIIPDGYKRIDVQQDSFAHWLRNLPLKEGNPPIYFYNGDKKFNQLANHSVIDIDIGDENLQQCADAVIRLRAEYLYSTGYYDSIAFNFTSGDRFKYTEWLDGKTPIINGNNVTWKQNQTRENNRQTFMNYLKIIFTYAGSYSLSKELSKVDINNMKIGDIFIEGGFPGHAMIVVDMAENSHSGEKIFLLAQSYMPAQNVHVVKNATNRSLSPWFKANFENTLYTLEWVFEKEHLMRFK